MVGEGEHRAITLSRSSSAHCSSPCTAWSFWHSSCLLSCASRQSCSRMSRRMRSEPGAPGRLTSWGGGSEFRAALVAGSGPTLRMVGVRGTHNPQPHPSQLCHLGQGPWPLWPVASPSADWVWPQQPCPPSGEHVGYK